MPKLDHRSAQAKLRALGKKAKHQPNEQTASRQNIGFAIGFIEGGEVHMI
jgi:hypothetical protein